MQTKRERIGDVIGDWFVRALAAWIVLGVLYSLLSAVGLTWERAPWGVVAVVAFWVGTLLLIAKHSRAAAPAR